MVVDTEKKAITARKDSNKVDVWKYEVTVETIPRFEGRSF